MSDEDGSTTESDNEDSADISAPVMKGNVIHQSEPYFTAERLNQFSQNPELWKVNNGKSYEGHFI